MTQATFLAACRDAIGAARVLTDPHDTAPYLTDWRRRYTGAACAVLCPATAEAAHYKKDVEVRMMRAVKSALDPLNLMNPGKALRQDVARQGNA